MLVLSRSAFRRKHATPMNLFEITVRELVSSLGLFRLCFVDAQVPSPVLFEPVLADILVLLLRRGLVLAPGIPLINDDFSFLNELIGVRIGSFVQFHCHGISTPFLLTSLAVARART